MNNIFWPFVINATVFIFCLDILEWSSENVGLPIWWLFAEAIFCYAFPQQGE